MRTAALEQPVAAELSRRRARMFVGREAEKQAFARLLEPAGEWRALYVHGLGGVGKTTLLNEFERLANGNAANAVRVNARDLPNTPGALHRALSRFVKRDTPAPLRVLLLDNFEYLFPLQTWFRETFLAQLPQGQRLVLAGRTPPTSDWIADPGWAAIVKILPMDLWSTTQAEQYLSRRGVPTTRWAQVLAFAHGHPLALALAADVLARQPDAPLPPEAEIEILDLLMAQLLRGIEKPEQLQVLRAAAIVRELSEPLLAHMLECTQVARLFDWLQQLSFVLPGANGLILHNLLRDAITRDLQRRDPAAYDRLVGRAYRFLLKQMAARPPAQCGPAVVDTYFVQRDTPLVQTIYRFEDEGHCYCAQPSAEEWPQIQAMVLEHEDRAALNILNYWHDRQPEGLIAVRRADQSLAGFLYKLELNGLDAAAAAADPVVARYLDYLRQHEPLRPDEHAILFRSWMAADTYQALSAVQTLVCAYILFCTLTTPNLACILHLQPDVESWTRIAAQYGHTRLPGPAATVGRYRAALYAHDYRDESPLQWVCNLHGVLRGLSQPAAVALDHAAFAHAVRQAFKNLGSARALQANPLLQCALVAEHPEAIRRGRAATLQALLCGHCERLRHSPKTLSLYDALHRTYLQPERNQALAAEALSLSERTYRRRLAAALEHITDALWLAEHGDTGA